MNVQALLVHGVNIWDGGRATVGELRGYFAARDVAYHILKYGHINPITTRFKNSNIAKKVADFANNSDQPILAVGHSNGCCIIHLAIQLYGANIEHAIFINPALDIETNLGHKTTFDVWHSPSDIPVRLARLLPKSKFRPWGAMGAYGAKEAGNVRNFNKERDFAISSNRHSDCFHTEKLSYFGPLMVDRGLEKFK